MYEYKCKVTRVVDGDTIDALIDLGFDIKYSSRVRLYGIDTPESRTRDKDEKVRGKMASAYLKEAVDNGDTVVLRTKLSDSRGKFGRVLASVVVDNVDINEAMIENHLAVAYFGQSKDDIEAEHMINREKLIELGKFDPSTVEK
jgi:micrococcal nuclease|tara:strand:- start:6862 stop:7293 length:432 start_codon:yes stop_codon:yes gene_type:complete